MLFPKRAAAHLVIGTDAAIGFKTMMREGFQHGDKTKHRPRHLVANREKTIQYIGIESIRN